MRVAACLLATLLLASTQRVLRAPLRDVPHAGATELRAERR